MGYGPACGPGGICPAQLRWGARQPVPWDGAYAVCSDEECLAVVVSLEAIAVNDYSLSIPPYVQRPAVVRRQ